MKQYEYKQHEASGSGWNPMIPGFLVELGKDDNGKEWLCKISPTNMQTHLMWNVDFDTKDEGWVKVQPEWETDDNEPETLTSPFLRPEVIYSMDSYGRMCRERYHRKTVEYINIKKTIDSFVQEHGIG